MKALDVWKLFFQRTEFRSLMALIRRSRNSELRFLLHISSFSTSDCFSRSSFVRKRREMFSTDFRIASIWSFRMSRRLLSEACSSLFLMAYAMRCPYSVTMSLWSTTEGRVTICAKHPITEIVRFELSSSLAFSRISIIVSKPPELPNKLMKCRNWLLMHLKTLGTAKTRFMPGSGSTRSSISSSKSSSSTLVTPWRVCHGINRGL